MASDWDAIVVDVPTADTSATSAIALVLDLVVVLVVVLAGVRGWRSGGVAPLARLGAVVAGLVAGLWTARLLSSSLSPVWHVVLGTACAVGGLVLGAAIGRRLTAGLVRPRPVLPDRVLGVVVRGATALVLCVFALSLVAAYAPPPAAAAARAGTLVPRSPSAVPVAGDVWRAVGDLVDRTAPADLAALVPASTLTAPSAATIAAVDATVSRAVLRVSAEGCGTGTAGTGFVAARDLVVTNAHVVRGAGRVSVAGHDGTVVAYDRRADLAVIRVDGLDVGPLTLAASDAVNGTAVVLVGYPEGGPRTAVGGTVIQRLPVPNPGLAGGAVLHQAYRLAAVVKHGNSGSPLLDTSRRVIGVVNALAADGDGDRGFAISLDELRPVLADAATSGAVGTGTCRTSP